MIVFAFGFKAMGHVIQLKPTLVLDFSPLQCFHSVHSQAIWSWTTGTPPFRVASISELAELAAEIAQPKALLGPTRS